MEAKETTTVKVISLSKKATLKTIVDDIGCSPDQLMADLEKNGVETEGPMIFVYRNCADDMDKPFDLEIAQPVKASCDYQGEFDINELEPIKYVEKTYCGSLANLGSQGYEPFIEDIQKSGLQLSNQCREVYHRYEGFESEGNITEIQMGIM